MKIEWDWDDGAMRRLEQEALARLRELATQAVVGVVCPDHGESVSFVPAAGKEGPGLEAIGQVEACCTKAARLGQDALAQALN